LDALRFEASLSFTDEVAALGITEEQAETFGIGCKRGEVYVPMRYPAGPIAGWHYSDESGVPFPNDLLRIPRT